jgi:hypothetical protein
VLKPDSWRAAYVEDAERAVAGAGGLLRELDDASEDRGQRRQRAAAPVNL